MIEIPINIQNYFIKNYTQWLFVIIVCIVGFFLIKIINRYVARYFDKVDFDRTLEIFIQKIIKIFLWVLLLIIILSNLGFNVTGFIAGLSIAGFIIGFATKDILSNLAAGIFLLINRPFRVGESVEIVNIKGIVKEISISACIIITDDKKYVTIPNSKIWGGPIKNLSRIKKK